MTWINLPLSLLSKKGREKGAMEGNLLVLLFLLMCLWSVQPSILQNFMNGGKIFTVMIVERWLQMSVIYSVCSPPRAFFLPPRNLFVLPNGFLQLSSRLLRIKFSPTRLVQHWPFLSTDMLSLFHIDMFYVDIQSFQLQVLMVHGT